MTQLIHLRRNLELVGPLKAACQQFQSDLLQSLQARLTDSRFAVLTEALDKVLHPDTRLDANPLSVQSQRIFAVLPGIHSEEEMGDRVGADYGLPSFQACWTLRVARTPSLWRMSPVSAE